MHCALSIAELNGGMHVLNVYWLHVSVKYDKTVGDEQSLFDDNGFFLQQVHCPYRTVDDTAEMVHIKTIPEKEAEVLIIPYCNSVDLSLYMNKAKSHK